MTSRRDDEDEPQGADPGPLARRRHDPSPLTGVASPLREAHGVTTLPRGSVLYGSMRGLYRPTVALRTIQRLGPVRHALAQRAICGIVEVHAPFVKKDVKD